MVIYRKFKFLSVSIILFIIICHYSCKKEEPLPTFTNQGSVGSEGGIIRINDGATVEIPPGALSTNQTISFTKVSEGENVAYNESPTYELKPDGLTFSDSITISLPFDDRFISLSNSERNFGICIMTYQDSTWVKLKTKIDVQNKTASVKTTHFSTYSVDFPNAYTNYFYENSSLYGIAGSPYYVPYYRQTGGMCGYNSLSMISRFAGYPYKAPFFLSLMNDGDAEDAGISNYDLKRLDEFLSQDGMDISTEIHYPWANVYSLAGYILQHLHDGRPVYLGIGKLHHVVVVTGNYSNGFYISDPSGVFLHEALENEDWPANQYVSCQVTYEQFFKTLESVLWTDATLVITSHGDEESTNLTLNFGDISIWERNDEDFTVKRIGELGINGKHKPQGYAISFVDTDLEGSFDRKNDIVINTLISNSSDFPLNAKLFVMINGQNLTGSPQIVTNIPKFTSNLKAPTISSSLCNLSKGTNNIEVELRSVDSLFLFDSWDVRLNISNPYPELISDIDGNEYKTVEIGSQIWMKENLKTTTFFDGTKIPDISNNGEWANMLTPGYCWYNNNPSTYKEAYGALYNWYAINTGKLCPTGWHVSSEAEWVTLTTYVGEYVAANKLKESGTEHWTSPNTEATDEYGFTALPGGFRDFSNGQFKDLGGVGYFWTSDECEGMTTHSTNRPLMNHHPDSPTFCDSKKNGFSVRCIKDE